MSSFFPWMGGKSKVAKRLASLLPEHSCYVELFAGAANLLFAKEKSKSEVLNDVNSELINLFRIVRWHSRAFIDELQFITHSRDEFDDCKNKQGLTDIQRAARSWFVMKTAFGGKGGTNSPHFGYGTLGKGRFRRSAFSTVRTCHKRLDGVIIENRDFEDIIGRYDRKYTAFFCDPPYWQATAYKTPFRWSDHERLAKSLAKIKGKFLLTINEHKDIKKLYKGFNTRRVPITYSIMKGSTKRVHELVIANYSLPKRLW